MSVSNNLVPISGDHSIKEAVLTVFLASKILKTKDFGALMGNGFKGVFSQFEPIETNKITFENQNLSIIGEPDAGFKFVKFNNQGKQSEVLRGINEENRFFISFHSLDYKGWTSFRDNFMDYLQKLNTFRPGNFVKAYSLSYLDQFDWIQKETYEASKMFREDSKYLPKVFFETKDTSYNYGNLKKEDDGTTYSDQLLINISDKIIGKDITINHNKAATFNDVIMLGDLLKDKFRTDLDRVHESNKEVLKDLLQNEVCLKIKITK